MVASLETKRDLQSALIEKIRCLPARKLKAIRWYICQILALEAPE